MLESRRDKRGRTYWVDTTTGRRARAPEPATRPRAYRVDTRGRGYWTYLDTGRRAPKPTWDAAPRYDSIGRPLDTTGRRVPRAAFAVDVYLPPAPPPPKPKPKRKPKRVRGERVRPKTLRKPRIDRIGAAQAVPGFKGDYKGVYTTRPTYSPPRDLQTIFRKWLAGAVHKSPVASTAGEVAMRQHGVMFKVRADLDTRDFAELTDLLKGEKVRVTYRAMGGGEWEVWMHLNLPKRADVEMIEQQGFRRVGANFETANRAAMKIYNFLDGFDGELQWNEYIETDEDLYEG